MTQLNDREFLLYVIKHKGACDELGCNMDVDNRDLCPINCESLTNEPNHKTVEPDDESEYYRNIAIEIFINKEHGTKEEVMEVLL